MLKWCILIYSVFSHFQASNTQETWLQSLKTHRSCCGYSLQLPWHARIKHTGRDQIVADVPWSNLGCTLWILCKKGLKRITSRCFDSCRWPLWVEATISIILNSHPLRGCRHITFQINCWSEVRSWSWCWPIPTWDCGMTAFGSIGRWSFMQALDFQWFFTLKSSLASIMRLAKSATDWPSLPMTEENEENHGKPVFDLIRWLLARML